MVDAWHQLTVTKMLKSEARCLGRLEVEVCRFDSSCYLNIKDFEHIELVMHLLIYCMFIC